MSKGFIFLVLLSFGLVSAKINLAVLPLDRNDLTESQASVLTDQVRKELFAGGNYNVIERSQMNAVLKEQSFQQSAICNASECAVQAGQLLGVDQIVVGSVSKFGSLWIISLRKIDVESGNILQISETKLKGEIEDLLLQGVPKVVLALEKTTAVAPKVAVVAPTPVAPVAPPVAEPVREPVAEPEAEPESVSAPEPESVVVPAPVAATPPVQKRLRISFEGGVPLGIGEYGETDYNTGFELEPLCVGLSFSKDFGQGIHLRWRLMGLVDRVELSYSGGGAWAHNEYHTMLGFGPMVQTESGRLYAVLLWTPANWMNTRWYTENLWSGMLQTGFEYPFTQAIAVGIQANVLLGSQFVSSHNESEYYDVPFNLTLVPKVQVTIRL